MTIHACPNAELGAADVRPGQTWLHYATDPGKQGTYEVDKVEGCTVWLKLLHGFDHGWDARHYVSIEVGMLLAHWEYVGLPR